MDRPGLPQRALLQYLSQAAGADAKKKVDILYTTADAERVQRERADRLAAASNAIAEPLPPTRGYSAPEDFMALRMAAAPPALLPASKTLALSSASPAVEVSPPLGAPPSAAARTPRSAGAIAAAASLGMPAKTHAITGGPTISTTAASLGLPPQASARAQALAEARAAENARLMDARRVLGQQHAELSKALEHVCANGSSLWRQPGIEGQHASFAVGGQRVQPTAGGQKGAPLVDPALASLGIYSVSLAEDSAAGSNSDARKEPAEASDALSRLVAEARATVARGPATLENLRRDRERIQSLAAGMGMAPASREVPVPQALRTPQQPMQPSHLGSLHADSNMPRAMQQTEADNPQRRLWGDRQSPDAPQDLVRGALAAQPLLAGGAPGGAGDSVARLAAASNVYSPKAGYPYAPNHASEVAARAAMSSRHEPPPLPGPPNSPGGVGSSTGANWQRRETLGQPASNGDEQHARASEVPDQSELARNDGREDGAPDDGAGVWTVLGAAAEEPEVAAPDAAGQALEEPAAEQQPRRRGWRIWPF